MRCEKINDTEWRLPAPQREGLEYGNKLEIMYLSGKPFSFILQDTDTGQQADDEKKAEKLGEKGKTKAATPTAFSAWREHRISPGREGMEPCVSSALHCYNTSFLKLWKRFMLESLGKLPKHYWQISNFALKKKRLRKWGIAICGRPPGIRKQ